MRGSLLFIAVGSFAVGVALRSIYPIGMLVVPPAVLLCSVCFGVWLFARKIYALVAAILICFTLLGGMREALVARSLPEAYRPFINTSVIEQGTVIAPPDIRATAQRLTVEIVRHGVKTRIIAVAPPYIPVQIGNVVAVSGKLALPTPFDTGSGRIFAYDEYLAKDGIFGVIQPAHIQVIRNTPNGSLDWYFIGWRWLLTANKFVQQKVQVAIAQPYAALAIGLLLGGKQGLGADLLNVFTTVGLVQIVVLSGYNVTIVADAVLIAFRWLPRRWGLLLAGMCVCAFVVAAGAESSAVRAALMALLSIIARATNRSYNILRALSIALFCMVLYNPMLLVYDPGFELSFAATIGLILGSPLLEVRLLWIRSDMLRELLSTTLAAQFAVLPLLLYKSGNLSLVAVPANILVAPAVPIAMMLTVVAVLGAIFIPPLAAFIGMPAFLCLWYIIDIAALFARLPFAHIIIPAFSFWFVLLAYALLMLGGLYLHTHPSDSYTTS